MFCEGFESYCADTISIVKFARGANCADTISIVKFTKGHNSVKNVGGVMVIVF